MKTNILEIFYYLGVRALSNRDPKYTEQKKAHSNCRLYHLKFRKHVLLGILYNELNRCFIFATIAMVTKENQGISLVTVATVAKIKNMFNLL